MSAEHSRFRLAAQAAFACATLHVLALAAMIVVLRLGLPPTAPMDRLRFLHEHSAAWKSAWALWVLTTAAMGFFYLSLHRALGAGSRGRWAVGLSAAGMLADLAGDSLYWSKYPRLYDPRTFAELDRMTALLSGGLANGAYTVAWMLLLWRAPFPRWFRALSIPGVAGGLALAVAGFVVWTPGLVAGTAVAIPCFTLWTAAVGRFCWKNGGDAATMPPHV